MLLCFPPQAPPFLPHLALPQLAGFLEVHGYSTKIIDLNVEMYHDFLHEFSVEQQLISFNRALSTFTDSELFYVYNEYLSACNHILWGLKNQSKKNGFQLMLLSASFHVNEYSSKEIENNLMQIDKSLHPFYDKKISDEIHKHQVLGISVCYSSQLIPALSLCRYVRRYAPQTIIVLGGSHITSIADALNNSSLCSLFDQLIVGPGEERLLELAERYESTCCSMKKDFGTNALHARWNDLINYRYLSPELVIPLCVSRGCYWGKCSFCNHETLYEGAYQVSSIEDTIQYINKVREQTGSKYFTFVDSVLPLTWLEQLSKETADMDICWEACTRLDKTEIDFSVLYKGGCRLLRFGLESGSQKVLNSMRKGIALDNAASILKQCFSAGISTFLYFFAGFPGENDSDSQLTINFITSNSQYINFANGGGVFYLGKGSFIYNNPKQFNISILRDDYNDLSISVPYSELTDYSDGLPLVRRDRQRNAILKLNANPHAIHSRIYDVHDFLYACYYGVNGLKNIYRREEND